MRSAAWSLLCLLILGACTTMVTPGNWPANAPPYSDFVTAYRSDEANQALQSEEQYLTWVQRFYEGRPGILGWNDITDSVLQDMNREQQSVVNDLGSRLGQRIAAEWAKDNAVRRIDTAMLSLWGSIMVTAESPETRLEAMRAINNDTRALLEGDLSARQITEERYAEFDSFF